MSFESECGDDDDDDRIQREDKFHTVCTISFRLYRGKSSEFN